MSRKFATSIGVENDVQDQIDPIDAEIATDALEVNEVSADLIDDVEDVEVLTDQTQDLENQVEEIEVLEDEVEAALENDNLEAAEVGMEAIRGRLRTIQESHGLNFSSILDRASKESIGANPKHLKTNLRIGLEGFTDTIKKIWQAIKDGFKKAWDWLADFWHKYVSEAGRLERTIESLEKTVREVRGTPKPEADMVAPGGLQKIVYGEGAIDKAAISALLAAQTTATTEVNEFSNALAKAAAFFKDTKESNIAAQIGSAKGEIIKFAPEGGKTTEFGKQDSPLAGGFFGNITGTSSGEGEEFKVEFKWTKDGRDPVTGDKRKFVPGAKGDLTSVLSEAKVLVKAAIALGKDFSNSKKALDEALKGIDKLASAGSEDKESGLEKQYKAVTHIFNEISKAIPGVTSTIAKLDIQAGQGAVAYVTTSLKTYKEDEK